MRKKPPEKPTGYNDPFDGNRLADNVRRGVEQRKAKAARWGRNRSYYFNDPPKREDAPDGDNSADHHFPLVQPFSDALGGWIVQTVTSVEPYCVPSPIQTQEESETDDVAQDVQAATWKGLKKANLRDALRRSAQPAAWANAGIIWQSESDEGRRLDVVDPTRFVVYPSSRSIKDCVLYGRSFDRTRGEIRAMAKKAGESGTYYFDGLSDSEKDDKVNALQASGIGGQSRSQVLDHPGQTDTVPYQSAPHSEDDLIDLWEIVVREPSDGSVKVITLHLDSGVKLKESKYPWHHPCAYKFQIKPEATDEFWTEGSLCQDMQGSQEIVNRALNVWDDGMEMATYGHHFAGSAAKASASKITKIKPGGVSWGVGLDNVNTFAPQVDVSGCPEMIEFIKSHMSMVTRLASLGAGGALKDSGDATATEVEQATAGQSTGVDDYVDTFSNDLPLLFAHAQELTLAYDPEVRQNPDLMVAMAKPYEWNVQVNSPMTTPRAQFRALTTLYQLAKDPNARLKLTEVVKRILQAQEAMGVTDATGLMLEDDPVLAVAEALGLPPEAAQLVAPHVQAMMAEIQALQQNAQLQAGTGGSGGGMAQEPGADLVSMLGGAGQTGTQGPPQLAG